MTKPVSMLPNKGVIPENMKYLAKLGDNLPEGRNLQDWMADEDEARSMKMLEGLS